jgi:addiction module HigA family antidote
MPMKNPPHPGTVVLHECIEPLGLTVTQAAEALGVTRTTLSELVNGKRGISPEMAIRLSQVFGGSAHGWIVQQANCDLAQIPPDRIKLKRLAVARSSPDLRRRALPGVAGEPDRSVPALVELEKARRTFGAGLDRLSAFLF